MDFDDDKTRLPEDFENPESSHQFEAGAAFGRYRIIRLLGRGGMGEVYEVEHRDLRSRHAIKLISPEILERAGVKERFKREAVVMARLRYPNIVHVDDFGEMDGRIWLRMELVGGEAGKSEGGSEPGVNDLSDLLTGKPMSENLVVDLLTQILDGLAYAHEQGVVHRDLKPSNILLQLNPLKPDSYIPKITDFGLVSLAGADWYQSQVQRTVAKSAVDPDATQLYGGCSNSAEGDSTKAMLGTFAYMSPEQKKGSEVDARSDLYSIGKIAFQMLTGEDNISFEMPSELVPGLDPSWDDWLRKTMATRSDRRWGNAEEMRDAMPRRDKATSLSETGHAQSVKRTDEDQVVGEAGGGKIICDLDETMQSGTVLSGSVTFRGGITMQWQLRASGQLGLVPCKLDPEYRPTTEELEEFQAELQKILVAKGF